MSSYILDTSVISAFLHSSHARHSEVRTAIQAVEHQSTLFLSAVSLAELSYGVEMTKAFGNADLPVLEQTLKRAYQYRVLDITKHTSLAYAKLKTNMAIKYLEKASRQGRPRWLEDWVDRSSGKKLQIDENDLWICAQAKERNLHVATLDKRMRRIEAADSEVHLQVL